MKTIVLGLFLAVTSAFAGQPASYTVHEWGTFTSIQGGDGKLLAWRPLQTSELPGFVYDWTKPGLNRWGGPKMLFKGSMVTLQRMETPVIYFYSGNDMDVNVSVDFPLGAITEWYPQASQIGPSLRKDTNWLTQTSVLESRAAWNNLHLLSPAKNHAGQSARLPQDTHGSHYFAAREVAADLIQTALPDLAGTNQETEQFIFYRGAGSFETPLRVRVDANNDVVMENTGTNALAHLFLVSIHDGQGAFTPIASLGSEKPVSLPLPESASPAGSLKQFQTDLAAQMKSALISAGLFPDEARAMVNTWKDSWFTETGDRVLYILPRPWTDEILPMTLQPAPEKLVRVMVGRAEMITPAAASALAKTLAKARDGDDSAKNETVIGLKNFGRFAEVALRLANLQAGNSTTNFFGYELLAQSAQPSGAVK